MPRRDRSGEGDYQSKNANRHTYDLEGAKQAFRRLAMGYTAEHSFPYLVTIGGIGFGRPVIELLVEKNILKQDLSLTSRGLSAIQINENPFKHAEKCY